MNAQRRDRGATLPIVAMLLPVLILMTSFAVDLGRQRADRRTMQAGADVVALDMVRIIADRTVSDINTDPATQLSLTASAQRNGLTNATLSLGATGPRVTKLEWGTISAVDNSFQPLDPLDPVQGALVPTATRVTTQDSTDYFFQPGDGEVTRTAVAILGGVVDLQVGSLAAGLQTTIPGGSAGLSATIAALNSRLGASFGATVPSPGTVGLTAVGYDGLAATDIDLWQLAETGNFASPNDLLAEDLTVDELLTLTARALDQSAAGGDPNAAAAAVQVRSLSSSISSVVGLDSTNTIQLGDFLHFEQGGDDAAATGSINVLDLLSGSADVINGKHFLSYSFDPGIPGVARANIQQYLVTPPHWEYGRHVGQTSENKQMGFQVTLDVSPLLGMSGPVMVPLIVEGATAVGTVDAIRCGTTPDARQVDIDVDTSVLSVKVGTASNVSAGDFTASAGVVVSRPNLTLSALLQLGVTGILSITNDLSAQASATILGANDQMLTFTPDVPPNPSQRAQGGVGATAIGTQLSNSLQAKYGLSLLSGLVNSNLASQLSYVFTNLDDLVVGPLLRATGLSIGGADVWTDNLKCNSLKLVG